MFYNQFFYVDAQYSLIIEDDDIVAYAYLMNGREIIGDVWLYNASSTPDNPEWNQEVSGPLRNSSFYAKSSSIDPIGGAEDIAVSWDDFKDGRKVAVFIRQKLHAILEEGRCPGWSVLAKEDGPLALKIRTGSE